jgi:hypothetical protein
MLFAQPSPVPAWSWNMVLEQGADDGGDADEDLRFDDWAVWPAGGE